MPSLATRDEDLSLNEASREGRDFGRAIASTKVAREQRIKTTFIMFVDRWRYIIEKSRSMALVRIEKEGFEDCTSERIYKVSNVLLIHASNLGACPPSTRDTHQFHGHPKCGTSNATRGKQPT